jgi:hypothetical protein
MVRRLALRACSGLSGFAQVKAAADQVRRRKRNQRKKKVILSIWEFISSAAVATASTEQCYPTPIVRCHIWTNSATLTNSITMNLTNDPPMSSSVLPAVPRPQID